MVNLITTTHETKCSNCNVMCGILCYGETLATFDNYICCSCSFKIRGAVSGASSIYPCKLCRPPVIRWYVKRTYGEISKDCGNHEINKINEEDVLPDLFD